MRTRFETFPQIKKANSSAVEDLHIDLTKIVGVSDLYPAGSPACLIHAEGDRDFLAAVPADVVKQAVERYHAGASE